MEKFDMETALDILQLKIKKCIEENKDKETKQIQEMIKDLLNEREQVYLKNEEVINKVLSEYSKQIK